MRFFLSLIFVSRITITMTCVYGVDVDSEFVQNITFVCPQIKPKYLCTEIL